MAASVRVWREGVGASSAGARMPEDVAQLEPIVHAPSALGGLVEVCRGVGARWAATPAHLRGVMLPWDVQGAYSTEDGMAKMRGPDEIADIIASGGLDLSTIADAVDDAAPALRGLSPAFILTNNESSLPDMGEAYVRAVWGSPACRAMMPEWASSLDLSLLTTQWATPAGRAAITIAKRWWSAWVAGQIARLLELWGWIDGVRSGRIVWMQSPTSPACPGAMSIAPVDTNGWPMVGGAGLARPNRQCYGSGYESPARPGGGRYLLQNGVQPMAREWCALADEVAFCQRSVNAVITLAPSRRVNGIAGGATANKLNAALVGHTLRCFDEGVEYRDLVVWGPEGVGGTGVDAIVAAAAAHSSAAHRRPVRSMLPVLLNPNAIVTLDLTTRQQDVM